MTLNEINEYICILEFVCEFCNTQIYTLLCCMQKSERKIGEQKMTELPFDRLEEEPLFTYCGVDLFGPFVI